MQISEFILSIISFKSSSIQHHVHFANYGAVKSEIDAKDGYSWGRGYKGRATGLIYLQLQGLQLAPVTHQMQVNCWQ